MEDDNGCGVDGAAAGGGGRRGPGDVPVVVHFDIKINLSRFLNFVLYIILF